MLPWRMTAALTLGSASRTKVAVAGATPARATKDTADVSVRRHCCRGCEEGTMQGDLQRLAEARSGLGRTVNEVKLFPVELAEPVAAE